MMVPGCFGGELMPVTRAPRQIAFLCAFILLIGSFAAKSFGQQSKLGKVDFPTSGGPAAQAHFLRGIAALHSFWFEEALDAFPESNRVEPDFMMGYWGYAMTYNNPL